MDDSQNAMAAMATAGSSGSVTEEPTIVAALRDSLTSSVECAICTNPFYTPSTIACGHTFCIHCLRMHLRRRPQCPICRQPVAQVVQLRLEEARGSAAAHTGVVRVRQAGLPEEVLEGLRALPEDEQQPDDGTERGPSA